MNSFPSSDCRSLAYVLSPFPTDRRRAVMSGLHFRSSHESAGVVAPKGNGEHDLYVWTGSLMRQHHHHFEYTQQLILTGRPSRPATLTFSRSAASSSGLIKYIRAALFSIAQQSCCPSKVCKGTLSDCCSSDSTLSAQLRVRTDRLLYGWRWRYPLLRLQLVRTHRDKHPCLHQPDIHSREHTSVSRARSG